MIAVRGLVPLMAVLALGLLTNWPMVSVADAHANLLASSPVAGQPAGGVIERIQLVFDEPITELVPSIQGPDGAELAISVATVTPQQFDLIVEPLELEGIYRVRYEFLSLDADRVELGYAFEFDRTAPAPLPISGPMVISGGGSSWQQWLIIGALVALVAIVVALAEQLRRRRRALARLAG